MYVLQDGWSIAHASFKAFVAKMFSGLDTSAEKLLMQLDDTLAAVKTPTTAVLQRVDAESGRSDHCTYSRQTATMLLNYCQETLPLQCNSWCGTKHKGNY